MSIFQARLGCSFSFPRATFTATDFDGAPVSLVGQVLAVEFRALPGGTIRLAINSDETLDAPALFDWTDSAGTLDFHLSPAQIETDLGVGMWTGVFKLLANDDVQHRVRDMTFSFEVVGA